MKILFLFPYPLEQAPSQRFRFEQYFDALLQAGHSINTQSFWGDYYWKVLYGKGNTLQKGYGLLRGFGRRLKILFQLPEYEVVFIHRELTPLGPPVFEWLIAKVWRKKIVYDFDDAIWLPNTSHNNVVAAPLKWHHKTANICQWAWKVSAGNEFLAAYALQHSRQVVLNPTTIDPHHHQVAPGAAGIKAQEVTVGWTGSHSTLPYLDLLWPVLEELQKGLSFRFLVIADKSPSVSYPWFSFLPWRRESEINDLATLDIGVMPLTDDDWSRGKCGFKALQYMALGIPTVASAVGANLRIITNGKNGFLCTNKEQWLSNLRTLITDADTRRLVGEAGKDSVKKHYSVASNTANFLSLFKPANR